MIIYILEIIILFSLLIVFLKHLKSISFYIVLLLYSLCDFREYWVLKVGSAYYLF